MQGLVLLQEGPVETGFGRAQSSGKGKKIVACIDSGGALSESGRRILAALTTPRTLEEVAQQTGLPLYRIRSGAREMLQAGLLEEKSGGYAVSPSGQKMMDRPQ